MISRVARKKISIAPPFLLNIFNSPTIFIFIKKIYLDFRYPVLLTFLERNCKRGEELVGLKYTLGLYLLTNFFTQDKKLQGREPGRTVFYQVIWPGAPWFGAATGRDVIWTYQGGQILKIFGSI